MALFTTSCCDEDDNLQETCEACDPASKIYEDPTIQYNLLQPVVVTALQKNGTNTYYIGGIVEHRDGDNLHASVEYFEENGRYWGTKRTLKDPQYFSRGTDQGSCEEEEEDSPYICCTFEQEAIEI